MNTTTIRLTQQAYIDGYDGAVLRIINEDGTQSPYVILDNWYSATAEDDDGNEYFVYWEILDDYDPEESEEYACNWAKPCMILDGEGKNVTANTTIASNEYYYI